MERPADDIFLISDLSLLQTPVPKSLFLGRSSDASSSILREATSSTDEEDISDNNDENIMKYSLPPTTINYNNNKNNHSSIINDIQKKSKKFKDIKRLKAKQDKTIKNSPLSQQPPLLEAKRGRGRPRKYPREEAVVKNEENGFKQEVDQVEDPITTNTIIDDDIPINNIPINSNSGKLKKNKEENTTIETNVKDDSPKIISLSEWSLATVPNSPKLTGVPVEERALWVVLVGRRRDMVEAWHSSIITERILQNHIKTGSGRSLYILDSPINESEMQTNGFSESFIVAFQSGFPEEWRTLLMTELERLGKNMKHTKKLSTTSIQTTTSEVPVKRGRGRPRKDSIDQHLLHNNSIDVPINTPNNSPLKNRLIEDIVNESLPSIQIDYNPIDTLDQAKRGRGRPRKYFLETSTVVDNIPEPEKVLTSPIDIDAGPSKRGRGRPRKDEQQQIEPKETAEPDSSKIYKAIPKPSIIPSTITASASSRRRSGTGGIVKWGWGGVAVIQEQSEKR